MEFFKEKMYQKIKPYQWFAWYPVWCWDTDEHNFLSMIWLEKVWRTNWEKGGRPSFFKRVKQ